MQTNPSATWEGPNQSLKEKAYKAMVRPQLEYAAPVWDPHIPRRYSENWNGSQTGSSVGLMSLFTILKCVRYARQARLANSRAASLWLTTGPLLQDRSLLYHPMSSHQPGSQKLHIHWHTGRFSPEQTITSIIFILSRLFSGINL